MGGTAEAQSGRTVSVSPATVSHLNGPTRAELKLIRAQFTNWRFKESGNAALGSFNILQYKPFAGSDVAAGEFSIEYDDHVAKPRTDYLWVQFANATQWGTRNGLAVDSKFNNFPFYSDYTPDDLSTSTTPTSFYLNSGSIWLDKANYPQQNLQNPAGGGKVPKGDLIMVDEPFMEYSPSENPIKPHADSFDLFLVTFTWNGKLGAAAGGTVNFRDGVHWGVTVIPEPSSCTLAGLGALSILAVRSRSGMYEKRARK
jgi:hypothetical protein